MKILVVRFSSIGDIVLTTPVIRCLKQQLPNAEIHYLTKKSFEPVLRGNPYIDRLICVEKSTYEVLAELKNEHYDFLIDLHNNIRTVRLKSQLRVKSSAFPKLNPLKLLYTAFKINRLPKLHVVDRYFRTVEKLGVTNDSKRCDFFLGPADEYLLPPAFSGPFVAVSLGAQYETKQMPLDLMVKILENRTVPIVLLGGPTDVRRAAELETLLERNRVLNLAGKISLRQSAFVLSKANVLLTGDTGLMHIASCFGVKIVSVWGNTVPDFGMYPYAQKADFTVHEVSGLTCRPCSKIGYHACPKKHFNCMNLQDPRTIGCSVDDFLP